MKEHISVARLKKAGLTFEVVIIPEQALMFRNKHTSDVTTALRDERVYTDANKGLAASEEIVCKTLGAGNLRDAAEKIIREGEIQLTSEIRERMRAQKRAQIINEIHRYGVDPKTNAPHPIARIEAAIEQAKVRIDESRPANDQVRDIIKQLSPVLPLRISVKRIEVQIPAPYASKAQARIRQYASLKKEYWQPDGSWVGEVELPGGMEADFYDLINGLTQGKAHANVVSRNENI